MNELLPVASTFLLGWVLILYFWKKVHWLGPILVVAYVLRCILAYLHAFVIELPQGASDAKVFNAVAVEWSSAGCLAVFSHLDPSASYVYSAILASLYGCFGPSSFSAQLLNCVLGTMTVAITALAAKAAWGDSVASRSALLVAVFPTMILYSAMTLREAAIVLMFSLGVLFVVRHALSKSITELIGSLLCFTLAAMLHGAMAFAAVGLVAVLTFRRFALRRATSRSLAMNGLLVAAVVLPIAVALYIYSSLIFIPKIGLVGELDSETVADVLSSRAQGDAAYLVGLMVRGPLDVLWQAPIRVAYLLFAPFPWNIGSPTHVFGFVDGTIYLWMVWRIRTGWSSLRENPAFWPLLIVIVCLALVFAFGTSNFGTGMRHRAKFLVALVVVAGPFLFRMRPLRKHAPVK